MELVSDVLSLISLTAYLVCSIKETIERFVLVVYSEIIATGKHIMAAINNADLQNLVIYLPFTL